MALTQLGTGGSVFAQIAPPKWNLNADDAGLDSVILTLDGAVNRLASYQSQLSKWSSCPIDNNMFLAGWSNDQHKQYPKMELRYIGLRSGRVPSIKGQFGTTIQSASRAGSSFSITILAKTQIGDNTRITRSAGELITVPAVSVFNTQVITWDFSYTAGDYKGIIPTTGGQALGFFGQVVITTYGLDELVPNKYYRRVVTSQVVLR